MCLVTVRCLDHLCMGTPLGSPLCQTFLIPLQFLMEIFDFLFSLYCTYVCVCYVRTFFHVLYIALYKCFSLLIPTRRMVSERRGRGHLTPPLKVHQTQCLFILGTFQQGGRGQRREAGQGWACPPCITPFHTEQITCVCTHTHNVCKLH